MKHKIKSLELFSGAGGLATGISQAGAAHVAFIELNKHACATLRKNYKPSLVHHIDIKQVDFLKFGKVDLIAGGPPCQPFSLGGKHKGNLDDRDLFPYATKAISACLPKAFIFENVKGLLRSSFHQYFEYIILRLTYPEEIIHNKQTWEDHLLTLQKIHASSKYNRIKYNVNYKLINAANYGIPQQRERVVIVGIRDDLDIKWSFPSKTHSLDALLWSQYVSQSYWDKHRIERVNIDNLSSQMANRAKNLRSIYGFIPPQKQPWQTVRDAIGNLPFPDKNGTFDREHVLREGARIYPGHTGSYIDLPAKAIKAGVHGVPGGENMMRFQNGSVRYFTTYEAKKIQTFPNDYRITGSWTEAMRQIGNAVPVNLSYIITKSLINKIWDSPSLTRRPANIKNVDASLYY